MAATGTVTINITGDVSRLRGALSEAETGLAGFQAKMQGVGETLTRIGSRMTVGVTLPLALLGKAAFDAASDLNESLNKVEVVFGENAAAIKQWSKDAAEAFGMSRQKALEAAGTFGNLFRALGLGTPQASDMSKKLVQLAADLASFNNANPEEVLLALRSGLVGEAEPLRKFGVSLSEARVAAKAMEMGLADADGQLSDSAKAQARYAIILEDTALAQGDFARTSDGAANKQRILKAEFEDAAAKLGTALLPMFTKLTDIVARVAEWFANLDPKWQNLIMYAGLAAAAIGPLATLIGGLTTIVAALLSPIALVAIALGAVAAAAVLLYLKWDEVWSWMRDHPAIAALILLMTGPITIPIIALVALIRWLQANWEDVWPKIQAAVEVAWAVIEPILNFLDAAVNAIISAAAWLAGVAENGFARFASAVQAMWSVVDGPLTWLYNRLQDVASVARAVSGVLGQFVPGQGGFDGSGVEDVLNNLGRRAAGGPVMAGSSYIVGENGPEVFTPSLAGVIVPNHALAGPRAAAGDTSYTFHIYEATDPERVMAAISRAVSNGSAVPPRVRAAFSN